MMTNRGSLILIAVGILLLGVHTSAVANTTDGSTPYQAIVDRNVFGLRPPAPPPDPEANKPPPPKIILTGIYKMGGNTRALMKVSIPPRPPEPAKEIPLILSEGQGSEGVEVLGIDTVASTVKVNNSGTVMTLDFTNNGAKVATASAPGGAHKTPGVGAHRLPNPFVPPAPGSPRSTARPVRPTGTPGMPGSATGYRPSSTSSKASGQPVTTYTALPTASGYNTSPGITVGGTASGTVAVPGLGSAPSTPQRQQNWPPEPSSPEEAAIMEAAYTQRYAQQIQAGTMPSIPGDNPLVQNQPAEPAPTPPSTANTLPLPPGAARRYVPQ